MDNNSSMEINTSAKPSTSFYECSWRPCSFRDTKLSVVSIHIQQHIFDRYSSDGDRTLEEEPEEEQEEEEEEQEEKEEEEYIFQSLEEYVWFRGISWQKL